MPTTSVLFLHGMYLNAASWQPWVEWAAAAGLDGHAISWPFHDGLPAERRRAIDPGLGHLTFGDVVAHCKQHIDSLPERPHVIGHSIGGLVVQKLVNDGYAASGVGVSPAPARGILSLSPHFLPANYPHINPFAGNRPVVMTAKRFRYTFGNTMSAADSDALFEQFVVPESRNVPRSTLTSQAAIDFARPHVPLRFLTGDDDHLTPLDAVRRNARAYRRGGPDAEVEVQVFPGRCHAICNQDDWQEVADAAFAFVVASGAG